MPNEDKFWFALYTKPKNEFKAALHLHQCGITYFLPTVVKLKQWSDRKKKIIEPIIRGYIFIFADEAERVTAMQNSAIIKTIFYNGRPAKIPAWQIENLKRFIEVKTEFLVHEGILPGSKVRIKEGVFAGIVGVIKELKEQANIIVNLDFINRSVLAKLPADTAFELITEEKNPKITPNYYYAEVEDDSETEENNEDNVESDREREEDKGEEGAQDSEGINDAGEEKSSEEPESKKNK